MREDATGEAGEEAGDDKRADFVGGGVHAHRFGGDFVFADREQCAAVAALTDALCADHDEDDDEPAGEKGGSLGHAREPERAAKQLGVLHDDADDLAEAEGHNREVVALEAQRRQADEKAEAAGSDGAHEQRDAVEDLVGHAFGKKADAKDRRGLADDAGDVRADGHEAGVADAELPGHTVDDVEADREGDVDADGE